MKLDCFVKEKNQRVKLTHEEFIERAGYTICNCGNCKERNCAYFQCKCRKCGCSNKTKGQWIVTFVLYVLIHKPFDMI